MCSSEAYQTCFFVSILFFFNDTATTEIYTLSLHDALPISEEQSRMHDTVARAQAAALAKMKPGSTGKSVDAAARNLIDRTKYKGRFIHGLGHSIGLAVHDGGALNASSDLVLRPNMVFTDEP